MISLNQEQIIKNNSRQQGCFLWTKTKISKGCQYIKCSEAKKNNETGKSVLYELLLPNDKKDESDEVEIGEETEVSQDGSDIIKKQVKNPDQAKKEKFYREIGYIFH